MLQDLEVYRRRVALEATLDVANMGVLFDRVFPSIAKSFTGFMDLFSHNNPTIDLSHKQEKFLREIPKHKYLDIAPLLAYTPEGLKVTYTTYADELQPAVDHASKVLSVSLNVFSAYLSQLLTTNDGVNSSNSMKRVFSDWEKQRDHLNKGLGKCFDQGSRTEVSIDRVIDRNGDWSKLLHTLEAMVVTMNTVNHSALKKKIDECVQLIEAVKNKGERGEMKSITPQVMDNLADGAYSVAREVEFYVATYYKVEAFSKAVDATLAHFDKVTLAYREKPGT